MAVMMMITRGAILFGVFVMCCSPMAGLCLRLPPRSLQRVFFEWILVFLVLIPPHHHTTTSPHHPTTPPPHHPTTPLPHLSDDMGGGEGEEAFKIAFEFFKHAIE